MGASATALVAYAAWTLALLGGLAILRTSLTLSGKRAANDFRPDGSDVSPFSGRLARAHANCYENLPVFAVLILAALATGNSGVTDALAPCVILARIAQSTIHLVSTSPAAVTVRFGFFGVQYGIQAWWAVQLLGQAYT